jgi:hypothetical protein
MANYKVSTNTYSNKTTHDKTTSKRTTEKNIKNNKMDHLRLFTLKYDLLKISVYLQAAFVAETHLPEGQWLKEQLNVLKLRMFRVGTRMPTVSRTHGHCLAPLKHLLKTLHRSDDA